MSLVGFKARNHEQQTARRGAVDDVDDRETHPENFAPLNERFRFTIDAAAASHNAKCDRYFTQEDNGLANSWAGERVWCNPPYSDLNAWVGKAWEEWWSGADLIVMLVPANRTEQRWWQEHVEPFRDRGSSPLRVEFLPGRMRFIRPGAVVSPKGDRPPFGCCLLIWERNPLARESSTPEAIGSTAPDGATPPHHAPGAARVLIRGGPARSAHGAQTCSCDSGLSVAECEAMRPYAWPVKP